MLKSILFGLLTGLMIAVALLVPALRLVVIALGVVLCVLAIVWFGRSGDEKVQSQLDEEIEEVRRAQRR